MTAPPGRGVNRRALKNDLYRAARQLRVGMYAIDCRYHPSLITESCIYRADPRASDISTKSLLDGTPYSCSIFHCGPEPITKHQAEEMVAHINREGWLSYLRTYQGYTDEAFADYVELAKVWGWRVD